MLDKNIFKNIILFNMPKSKLRKNHKQKVQAWKTKNEQITARFNNKLREAIKAQSDKQDEIKIQTKS